MAPAKKRAKPAKKRSATKHESAALMPLESSALLEHYRIGKTIYKRFGLKRALSLTAMKAVGKVQWFALTSDYGESYGPVVHTYVVRKQPRLINVGLNSIRGKVREVAEAGEGRSLAKEFNPDEQWSGGTSNHKFTNLVRKYFGNKYDGTIVVENNSATSDDNQGATEITLWRFSEILMKV